MRSNNLILSRLKQEESQQLLNNQELVIKITDELPDQLIDCSNKLKQLKKVTTRARDILNQSKRKIIAPSRTQYYLYFSIGMLILLGSVGFETFLIYFIVMMTNKLYDKTMRNLKDELLSVKQNLNISSSVIIPVTEHIEDKNATLRQYLYQWFHSHDMGVTYPGTCSSWREYGRNITIEEKCTNFYRDHCISYCLPCYPSTQCTALDMQICKTSRDLNDLVAYQNQLAYIIDQSGYHINDITFRLNHPKHIAEPFSTTMFVVGTMGIIALLLIYAYRCHKKSNAYTTVKNKNYKLIDLNLSEEEVAFINNSVRTLNFTKFVDGTIHSKVLLRFFDAMITNLNAMHVFIMGMNQPEASHFGLFQCDQNLDVTRKINEYVLSITPEEIENDTKNKII